MACALCVLNLGLEPFFDAGSKRPKFEGHYLIASDAGAPLSKGFNHAQLSVFRLKRVADIMSDQARALRVRGFTGYLREMPEGGAYLHIDTPVAGGHGANQAQYVASFPTTLRRLQGVEFDRIAEHGYLVSLKAENEYGLYGAANSQAPEEGL